MGCIVFSVVERNSGWFVGGGDLPIGPFLSRLRAIELATGMVEAMHSFGAEAELVIEKRGECCDTEKVFKPLRRALRRLRARRS